MPPWLPKVIDRIMMTFQHYAQRLLLSVFKEQQS